MRHPNHSRSSVSWSSGCVICMKSVGVLDILLRARVVISSGMDVVRVYSIKYVPAVSRSAC